MLTVPTDCLLMHMDADDLGLIRRCTTRMPVLGTWLIDELDFEVSRRGAPGGTYQEAGNLALPYDQSTEDVATSLKESCLAFTFSLQQPGRERVAAFFKSLHFVFVCFAADRLDKSCVNG